MRIQVQLMKLTEETQSTKEETEGFIEETPLEAEIVEDEKLKEEEVEELLESEKEKDMRKNRKN